MMREPGESSSVVASEVASNAHFCKNLSLPFLGICIQNVALFSKLRRARAHDIEQINLPFDSRRPGGNLTLCRCRRSGTVFSPGPGSHPVDPGNNSGTQF